MSVMPSRADLHDGTAFVSGSPERDLSAYLANVCFQAKAEVDDRERNGRD